MIYKDKEDLIKKIIKPTDVVLDIGFWGQGVDYNNPYWVHGILKKYAKEVCGLDIEFDESIFSKSHYKKVSAENFDFDVKFDVIFAADIIEHLSNPGLFLQSCKRNLKSDGKIIICTPNCFNLFNIAAKFMHDEPIMNKDETCYFNSRSLKQLCRKNLLKVTKVDFLYTLGLMHKESFKKYFLNIIYYLFSTITGKYCENVIVTVEVS